MPTPKELAKAELEKLVARFSEQYASYKQASYSEALVRKDFIDPFFRLLGWDMDNNQGYAEAYREVIHEDKVKVGGALKAPDYSFRLPGGKRLFFVEAKKPSVKVKTDVEPAYQVRRYAWSAKLPISILTDFEEFSVYDCTKRPEVNDSASKARVKYLTYDQYLPEFDFLWDTFSKEQVLKGSFDRYLKSDAHKRGTSTVDKAFLESLDQWRTYLATSISIRNKHLDEEAINFVVQHILDRLIFLRIAEDRGVEPYGQLKAILKEKGDHYPKLFDIFQHADRRYNSGLFDFKKDEVSEGITVDNKVVKTIVEELYYPESPYEFSVISVEILGSAYEQFLGKQIRIDSGHRARIEEKPEVRHAGGVYYTPQYIVEYIVERTVGELVKGKKPAEVEKLRIVDPACGSGSFLLGAYDYLLNWHKEQYGALKKMRTGKKSDKLRPDGELTTAEKKRILVHNIYGVDLDANAVEVTKLSLLLKCMEGETEASINQQLGLFHDRVLPTLDKNVQCGNSLIAPDIYDMTEEVDRNMRPFDWATAFPTVFHGRIAKAVSGQQAIKAHLAKAGRVLKDLNEEGARIIERFGTDSIVNEPNAAYGMSTGGFDAVIGNPPYVRSQFLDELSKRYFASNYEPMRYQPDTFALFMVKGIRLLREGGRMGFIIPNGILTNTHYATLRHYILTQTALDTVVDLKDGVFSSAAVDTSIFVMSKSGRPVPKSHLVQIGEWKAKETHTVETPTNTIEQHKLLVLEGHVFNTSMTGTSMVLLDKIRRNGQPLGELVTVKNGMKVRKELLADEPKDKRYKPFIVGGQIERFSLKPSERWVCYDRKLEAKYTNQAFRDESIFTAPEKLLVRQVYGKKGIHCAMDRSGLYCDQTCYILLPSSMAIEHIGGILCSDLMRFYFGNTLSDRKATFPKIKGDQLKQLPIAIGSREQRKAIGALYSKLAKAEEQLREPRLAHQETASRHKFVHLERQLNEAVFALYGLNEREVELVMRSQG
ncbi:MAG: N-6 DNA methylase [Flavobacteriales bacterium]|nr:N-6 DNA methylase [Flavobacteriales bacterium]